MSGPAGDLTGNDGDRSQMDRQFAELLQELRVGQTGVQLLFGFLLTIPFTTRYAELRSDVHRVFAVTLMFATLALTSLMAPVLFHRVTFRRKIRPKIIKVSHYSALAGMYLLMAAILGAVYVVASVAVPGSRSLPWLLAVCALGLTTLWVVIPLVLRETAPPTTTPAATELPP